jgi:threonine aldolase
MLECWKQYYYFKYPLSEFRCRRIRKSLGGSMRQAGIVAAAGVYALDNCVERLAVDHWHAKKIGNGI